MNYKKDSFISRDSLNLRTHEWKADSKPQFLLMIIHGLGEHGKCYESLAEFFVKRSCLVVALDLRGHGESDGKRGHTQSYQHILDDILDFENKYTKHYKELRPLWYGHSLGGNILLNFLLTHKSKAVGAIASAPFLRTTSSHSRIKMGLARFLHFFFPSMSIHNGLKREAISSEKAYTKDILLHSRISLELVLSSIKQGMWALDAADKIALPLLLCHGTADKVTHYEASVDFIQAVDDNLGRLLLYDGMPHELHHEDNKEKVFNDIYSWIKEVSH